MHEQTYISSHEAKTTSANAKDVSPLQKYGKTEFNIQPSLNLVIQPKLSVGAVDVPLEREADRIADQVMRMPENSLIQRNCQNCEEEDKLQRKPMTSFIQKKGSKSEMSASDSVSNQINSSRGKGSTLSGSTKSFMESRFGSDFSKVNIHTGGESTQLSRNLGAKAFTVGNDIYFNSGQYAPDTSEGKQLLAHELTHTVQQGGLKNSVQRTLMVHNPTGAIPNPGGSGVTTTNRNIAKQYLREICPDGNISVDNSGRVLIGMNGVCTIIATPTTPVGCECLCDMVASSNNWVIKIDDATWPHTRPSNHNRGSTVGSGGTGGIVTAPSPNDQEAWGGAGTTGRLLDIAPWLILGHELCGHAWMMNTGDHGLDETQPRGEGGHQATVERENLLRDEHSIERRGTHREPYCGESFSHTKGAAATPASVTWSSYLGICRAWRTEYNRLNGTNYSISDRIPVTPGETLP